MSFLDGPPQKKSRSRIVHTEKSERRWICSDIHGYLCLNHPNPLVQVGSYQAISHRSSKGPPCRSQCRWRPAKVTKRTVKDCRTWSNFANRCIYIDIVKRIMSPRCPAELARLRPPTAKPKRLTDSRAEYLIKASQGGAVCEGIWVNWEAHSNAWRFPIPPPKKKTTVIISVYDIAAHNLSLLKVKRS